MEEMGIGELARRVGVAASTVRYYEAQGVLPRARRVNGQRRYGLDALARVEVAIYARSVGFSVAEVKRLFGGKGAMQERWRALARAKVGELAAGIERSRRIKRALEAGLACGCIRPEDCLPRR